MHDTADCMTRQAGAPYRASCFPETSDRSREQERAGGDGHLHVLQVWEALGCGAGLQAQELLQEAELGERGRGNIAPWMGGSCDVSLLVPDACSWVSRLIYRRNVPTHQSSLGDISPPSDCPSYPLLSSSNIAKQLRMPGGAKGSCTAFQACCVVMWERTLLQVGSPKAKNSVKARQNNTLQ